MDLIRSARTFAFLTLGLVFTLVLIWFLLVQKARQSRPEPPLANHALLEKMANEIVLFLRSPEVQSPETWPPEPAGLWLDARVTADGEIALLKDMTRPDAKNGWPKPVGLINSTDPELSGVTFFRKIADRLKGRPVILHLLENREGVDRAVLAALKGQTDLSATVLVSAESEGLLRDLRKQAPSLAFAASSSSLTRMQTLAPLFLEGLIEAQGDVFLIPLRQLGHRSISLYSSSLLEEAKRRGRYVVTEWTPGLFTSPSEADAAFLKGVRGLITSDLRSTCAALLELQLEQRIGYCTIEKH